MGLNQGLRIKDIINKLEDLRKVDDVSSMWTNEKVRKFVGSESVEPPLAFRGLEISRGQARNYRTS